nr:sigma 54-interacting transcriptional regulator [uncultured Bacillus sp.]
MICNSFFSLIIGIPLKKILTMSIYDLLRNKVYNKSTALEALQSKRVVSEVVTTRNHICVCSTSTPITDPTGEVIMVVTNSHLLNSDEYSKEEKRHLEELTKAEYSALEKELIYDKQIVAESLSMRRILQSCNQIAPFDSKVLLYGESGTGKDVLSNYIHQRSKRKDASFVSVNCAAIPESLFESELFGHEKGAFTGASSTKQGLIEVANGGTLFLDEISEMPLELQAKLLRVLESHEFRRIGGTETFNADFRLISATNRDLKEMVDAGEFRRDLYYRINVIPIHIPPLRNRKQDIIALVNKYINELNKKFDLDYQPNSEHLEFILSHNWPGNVRELKNYVERLVVTNEDSYLHKDNSGNYLENNCFVAFKKNTNLKDFLSEAEKQYILKVLKDCNGKVGEAANQLGIHRTALYRKLKTYDIQ